LSGVYQLSLSADGSKLAFATLNKSGFDIFLMRNPFDRSSRWTSWSSPSTSRRSSGCPPPSPLPWPRRHLRGRASSSRRGEHGAGRRGVEGRHRRGRADSRRCTGKASRSTSATTRRRRSAPRTSRRTRRSSRCPPSRTNLDEEGNFRVNRYQAELHPGHHLRKRGYDTFLRRQRVDVMAFSDLLGDHQIILSRTCCWTSRTATTAFSTSTCRTGSTSGSGLPQRPVRAGERRFRREPLPLPHLRGQLVGAASERPFHPVEFGISYYNILRENWTWWNAPVQERTVIVPGFGYVYDTSSGASRRP